jgi:thioredoxin-related protein
MRSVTAALAALMLSAAGLTGAAEDPGTLKGGVAYTLPHWFKPSFLDFRQDVAEARKQGRYVMVFLHLEGCPYCARMLEENFVSGDNHDFMRKHFEVIAVNVRGSLEATWTDGAAHNESTLARSLGVIGTPTIVFLGEDGRKVIQLNGYQDPRTFRGALEFVQSKRYRSGPLSGGH